MEHTWALHVDPVWAPSGHGGKESARERMATVASAFPIAEAKEMKQGLAFNCVEGNTSSIGLINRI